MGYPPVTVTFLKPVEQAQPVNQASEAPVQQYVQPVINQIQKPSIPVPQIVNNDELEYEDEVQQQVPEHIEEPKEVPKPVSRYNLDLFPEVPPETESSNYVWPIMGVLGAIFGFTL